MAAQLLDWSEPGCVPYHGQVATSSAGEPSRAAGDVNGEDTTACETEMHFLEPEQVHQLADAIDDRYRAAIYLAAYGGLRAGELWALRVERMNVLAAAVEVAESVSEAGGLHVGPT